MDLTNNTSARAVRYEHLEDQLNTLTELHQHEMTDLKQELASIEERVAYQAHERARDIQVAKSLISPVLPERENPHRHNMQTSHRKLKS